MLFAARVRTCAPGAAARVRADEMFRLFDEVAFAHPVAFALCAAIGAEGRILILHGQKLFKAFSAFGAEKRIHRHTIIPNLCIKTHIALYTYF